MSKICHNSNVRKVKFKNTSTKQNKQELIIRKMYKVINNRNYSNKNIFKIFYLRDDI